MAEPSGGGSNGNAGEEGNRPRGSVETPESRIDDQATAEPSSSVSAVVAGSGGDSGGHAAAVTGGDEGRTPGGIRRTPGSVVIVCPRVRRLDARSGIEGLVVTGLGSAGVRGDGRGGDGGRPEAPVKDPARGKGPMVEEGVSGGAPVEGVEFRPDVGSSAHVPISRGFCRVRVGGGAWPFAPGESGGSGCSTGSTRGQASGG
ncbi:uncharacterized protein LOC131327103 [Rhododendron vialii]|uniref:uncharacterized protein LOC131327103 n=1 Tax=Rhododendron vialii TaxID=182163 RepID=UPI00265FACAB|nr:uncharacterized protein LOC131327103 [Rhododendron vialii]